jgi:hypothetical protein
LDSQCRINRRKLLAVRLDAMLFGLLPGDLSYVISGVAQQFAEALDLCQSINKLNLGVLRHVAVWGVAQQFAEMLDLLHEFAYYPMCFVQLRQRLD